VGSEYVGPLPDPSLYQDQPIPIHNRITVPLAEAQSPQQQQYANGYPPYPSAHPGYPEYPTYPRDSSHRPYYDAVPYGYDPTPAQPRRDRYLLAMAIVSFVASILSLLAGLVSMIFLILIIVLPTTSTMPVSLLFGGIVQFVALTLAFLLGGGFGLYHSIRSLFLKRPSADFKLPWFWIFLLLYLGVILIASILRSERQAVANTPLAVALIILAGSLPAIAVLALGVRRVHFPRSAPWSTSWRRFSMAIISGTTLAIVIAGAIELGLVIFVSLVLKVRGFSITNLDQPLPQDTRAVGLVLIVVSVIAPLVEEAVKPLAVVVMIGRMRSAAEAFVLGLACGIGFDLVETSGYIAMGYRDWSYVALQRSSAGLLHGFGAGMVALGWYYLTHGKSNRHRIVLGLGCWAYALLQHAIWNGSSFLQILPAPIGPFLSGNVPLGPYSFPAFLLVLIAESFLMLAFFVYVTGKLRGQSTDTPALPQETGSEVQEAQVPTHV